MQVKIFLLIWLAQIVELSPKPTPTPTPTPTPALSAVIGSPGRPNDYPNLSAVPVLAEPTGVDGLPLSGGEARESNEIRIADHTPADSRGGRQTISIADIFAQLCEQAEAKDKQPWSEPTPLPMNRDREIRELLQQK